jgi:hypothetical protein
MNRRFALSLFLVGFICAAHAQLTTSNNPAASANANSLTPLINLVLDKGKPNNAEVYIVQNLGLGDRDIPVMQKGWKSSSDRMNHLVAVSTKNHDDVLLFLFNENIEGVCWLTSKSGQVRATVAFSRGPHTSRVIANELDLKAFEREKKYLLGKVYAAAQKNS